jgi:hypothetical protein
VTERELLADCLRRAPITMKACVALFSVLVLWAFGTASLTAGESEVPPQPIEITLQGSVYFGYADGFLQTPIGGQPGTTSHQRPTLHELNIDEAVFYEGSVRWQRKDLGFYAGYHTIGLDGSGTLTQPLVSHGVSFAAGEPFHTNNRLDWYDAGAGWSFFFMNRRLEVFPKADFAVLDFSYKLSTPSANTSRSYAKGCVRLGAEGSYRFTSALSFKLDGAASLPLSNTPQIATLAGTFHLDLLPHRRRLKPALFAGGGMEWIDYEDNQQVPNHIHVNLGPFVTGGLALSF